MAYGLSDVPPPIAPITPHETGRRTDPAHVGMNCSRTTFFAAHVIVAVTANPWIQCNHEKKIMVEHWAKDCQVLSHVMGTEVGTMRTFSSLEDFSNVLYRKEHQSC
jgi:hypothetical protein